MLLHRCTVGLPSTPASLSFPPGYIISAKDRLDVTGGGTDDVSCATSHKNDGTSSKDKSSYHVDATKEIGMAHTGIQYDDCYDSVPPWTHI